NQGSMNQHLRPDPVPFIDVAAQRRRLGTSIDEAVARVLAHCQFINGPEVTQLEAALAAFSGARHVVTCASGTDALLMVLTAKGVGRGDAVLCPSFTFCATGEAVALAGATPVLHDEVFAIAIAEGMFVLDDAAQAFGASYKRRRLGGMGMGAGVITATSFFPAKAAGCLGRRGAIFSRGEKFCEVLRSVRVHG